MSSSDAALAATERIAELGVGDAPEEDRIFLERVADLVAVHCLVGWDTGGESWDP